MLKKSTLLFVSIFVLLFIGLSNYGYGHHRIGHDKGGGGGGNGGGGGGNGGLTANLTGGTFVFADGPLPVNLNARETTARSDQDVDMTRPPDGDLSQFEWDAVFAECLGFLGGLTCPHERVHPLS